LLRGNGGKICERDKCSAVYETQTAPSAKYHSNNFRNRGDGDLLVSVDGYRAKVACRVAISTTAESKEYLKVTDDDRIMILKGNFIISMLGTERIGHIYAPNRFASNRVFVQVEVNSYSYFLPRLSLLETSRRACLRFPQRQEDRGSQVAV
jgi:hypothetical protein